MAVGVGDLLVLVLTVEMITVNFKGNGLSCLKSGLALSFYLLEFKGTVCLNQEMNNV